MILSTTLLAAALFHTSTGAPIAPEAPIQVQTESVARDAKLARYIYPLAPTVAAPKIVVNTKEAPDTQAWADTAASLMHQWYPYVRSLMATTGAPVPKEIRLVIKPKIGPPAYCAGNEITVKAEWIREHPDDLGCVIHEMAHAIQAYQDYDGKPGWLVEGIADYIRWWRYEPEPPRQRIDPAKMNYDDSYRVTAYWLAWTMRKYDNRLVSQLDAAMRMKKDPMPVFKELTGKDAPALWAEFVASKP